MIVSEYLLFLKNYHQKYTITLYYVEQWFPIKFDSQNPKIQKKIGGTQMIKKS